MDDYVEVKQKPGGDVHEYPTELIHRGRSFVLVRFQMRRGGGPPDIPIRVEPGSTSLGFFWSRRPYNLYLWRAPAGHILAHRIDAVTDVRITSKRVEYRDLVLDWWVLPGDVVLEEDRDEFDLLARSGLLSARDLEAAVAADRIVHSRYRHIIDEAECLERRFASVLEPRDVYSPSCNPRPVNRA